MSNAMDSKESDARHLSGGAVGAGLVLVVLPSVALFFGAKALSEWPLVGLPVLAIFGIMILFGALSLTSTLFARLKLDNRSQPLALPEGSIRAAIALALIVLFAIIAILLHQTASPRLEVKDLSEAQKNALVRDYPQRVMAVVPTCASSSGAKTNSAQKSDTPPAASGSIDLCADPGPPYRVDLMQVDPASADLAKQLLILIGTLMTSVVSFYFGSRASEPQRNAESSASDKKNSVAQSHADTDHDHGPPHNLTQDHELPAATGGVVS